MKTQETRVVEDLDLVYDKGSVVQRVECPDCSKEIVLDTEMRCISCGAKIALKAEVESKNNGDRNNVP